MIVSRERGYIFVHIPKTGGTSIALALEDRAMADDILIGDTPKAKRRKNRLKGVETDGRLWKHATLSDAHGLITADEMVEMFCVTLVRNPWDRIVSYYHWLQEQSFDHPAVMLSKQLGFSDFIDHPSTEAALRAAPYSSYMRDPDGIERADHYIRLEHLQADLEPFEAHLGFSLAMPHVNRSQRDQDFRSFYSDTDANRIADVCAEDIARFGYNFA